MQVELHPEALAEVRAAAIWYDERQPGLGDRFVSEVAEALARIAEAPAAYSIWVDSGAVRVAVRKASVAGFPYLIAFEILDNSVFVLAVAHGKRRPLYWVPRSRGPAS